MKITDWKRPPAPTIKPKGNKFSAKKVVVDGLTFDSRKESARWFDLKLRERLKEISGLRHHVEYEIIPAQDGERAACYTADFVYFNAAGKLVVEDVKSVATRRLADYVLRRKLMLQVHGIRISEV